MKRSKRIVCVAAGAALVGLLAGGTGGAVIKVLHVRNPGPADANDMHVNFKNQINENEPNNPRGVAQGRSDYPSDRFDGVTILQGRANFGAGSLPAGATDNFRVKLDGGTRGNEATAENIVQSVTFTNNGTPILTLQNGPTAEQKKAFKQNVTGFTNLEYFDFTDTTAATFNMLNPEAELGVKYTVFDFKLYSNLPDQNFTLSDYMNIGAAVPVFSAAELSILPGATMTIPFGAVNDNTYAMATIGTLRVELLNTRLPPVEYPTPQQIAETVPEPAILGSAAIAMLALARRRPA